MLYVTEYAERAPDELLALFFETFIHHPATVAEVLQLGSTVDAISRRGDTHRVGA